ncbi:uncharacterized protein BDR25DRAFT_304620 [Lindgomyces ingoldianus]|uniref:Uncharacterized protein n=1 Tax=Lindgomyces ingoldianus TaxID=673940 RepID=A0ACB6QQ20_9PLEO|nr:uncharacterized protein BDR25DRAFT_304620 [Lindgomyces ingoldianus]KAF2469083.1 hypothetical protein BDR25DRAFT_304620 [Lindgomyces ingoldianus]
MASAYKPRIPRNAISQSVSILEPNDTARKAVLSVFELIEQILLQLPMYDLLMAQSVCTRWRTVILSSSRIQRDLYFLPREVPSNASPADLKPNPVLAAAFEEVFEISKRRGLYHIWQRDFTVRKAFCMEILLHSTMDSWTEEVKYKEASWRRMLMTQPPVSSVAVTDLRVAPDYDDCFAEWVDIEEGVRMGDLLELNEDYVDAR